MIKYFILSNVILYIISIIIIYTGAKNRIKPCDPLVKFNSFCRVENNRFKGRINLFINPK